MDESFTHVLTELGRVGVLAGAGRGLSLHAGQMDRFPVEYRFSSLVLLRHGFEDAVCGLHILVKFESAKCPVKSLGVMVSLLDIGDHIVC